MRKSLLLLFLLVIVWTPKAAPMTAYYLFADADHEIYAYCPGSGIQVLEMWIWVHADNNVMCAEFIIGYSPLVFPSTITPNTELISESVGDLDTGISVCYTECQYDWHWLYHQTLYLIFSDPGEMTIHPHPNSAGVFQARNCAPGNPYEPATWGTCLYFNDPCPPGL